MDARSTPQPHSPEPSRPAGQAGTAARASAGLAEQQRHAAEPERRDAEIRALLARQEASNEVLKTISASPGDPQPVFDLIMRRARVLCDAQTVSVMEYDGAMLRLRAMEGFAPDASASFASVWPRPATRESVAGRAVLARRIVHVTDLDADPDLMQVIRDLGPKTLLGVPLLRGDQVIGVIILTRFSPGGFDDTQIALVQSFADQAVIAIASASTLGELRQRTMDLQEALDYQTATSDVLKVISRSTVDLGPVLETLVVTAARLCEADMAFVLRRRGEEFHAAASIGFTDAYRAFLKIHPITAGRGSVTGRVAQERRAIQIPDVAADPEYTMTESITLSGQRTALGVPLLREDALIGVIVLARRRVAPFTDRQIELVSTFADQAVIAIENARLLGELQVRTAELAERNDAFSERIEHQSATIDVLKVMSASPGDPQPVFDLITRRATELCHALTTPLIVYDGTLVHFGSVYTTQGSDTIEAYRRQFPRPPQRGSTNERAILERRIIHVRDVPADPEYSAATRLLNFKSAVAVPLLRDGAVIGAIGLGLQEIGGVSDTQLELLKTFAEQAVIAITSAETFRELQARTAALAARNSEYGERIEQQSATIDVLKAMSSSQDDTQPVFDLIAQRAMRFCGASGARLVEFDGNKIHLRAMLRDGAWTDEDRSIAAQFPLPPSVDSIAGNLILERRMVHIRDRDEGQSSPAGRRGNRRHLHFEVRAGWVFRDTDRTSEDLC